MKKLFVASIIGLALSGAAIAAPIITTYDINQASVSGTGNWKHTYNGTIKTLGNGKAHYTGGGGTLNDGFFGSSLNNTQLFDKFNSTSITLNFDQFYTFDSLSLYGGSFTGNFIPGTLTGASVTIGDSTVKLNSTAFGVNADLLTFAGTGLELLRTNQITLSGFKGGWGGYMSISEITASGAIALEAAKIPEPGSLLLLGIGALVAFGASKRKLVK